MKQTSVLHRAWAEINLDALQHNVACIRETLPDTTEFMAVVKADAYGHGDEVICTALHQMGVHWYAVSNLEEALAVRQYCPDSEIFILGYTPPELAQSLSEHNIIQGVMSTEYAAALAANAGEQPVRCHIKLDTGMGRIGFRSMDEAACVAEILPLFAESKLSIEGLYTHFSVADCPDDAENCAYTDAQEKRILTVYDLLAEAGHLLPHLHFMNSAATVYRPNPRCTLARVGIILYGLLPNYPVQVPLPLQPVMTLKSVISHIKTVEAGDNISYGRTYTATQPRRIATVTIGYADGYARLLSGKASALVHGVACPIVGRVCMDQLMLDISDVPVPVHTGDEVTMFGKEGDEQITPDELAALYGTIGYEIVCGISKRVPRVVVNG
jgi:alanine racemase